MVASAIGACVVGYFLYHTIEGEHGWVAEARLQTEVGTAQASLAKLQSEHEALEHRVHLMRPESLDPDLLDEESRKTLNYSKPNEIIILSPQDKTGATNK
jgi:cell division protein FtsB